MIISNEIDKAVVNALRLGQSEYNVARRFNIRVSAVREIAVQELYRSEVRSISPTGRCTEAKPEIQNVRSSSLSPNTWFALAQVLANQKESTNVFAKVTNNTDDIFFELFNSTLTKQKAKPASNVYELVRALPINEKRTLMKSLLLEIHLHDEQNKTSSSSPIQNG